MVDDAREGIARLLGQSSVARVACAPAEGACLPHDGEALRREREAAFGKRGEQGDFGAMEYMKNYAGKHYHPKASLPWCESLLVLAVPVWQDLPQEVQALREDPGYGLVARYAWGRDYHKVLGKILADLCLKLDREYPGEQWKPWVDAHPLDEVFFAQASGLGFRGRHGLCIAGNLGTWFALGIIATSRRFEPGLLYDSSVSGGIPAGSGGAPGGCPQACCSCVKACPGGAIIESPQGWRIEPTRCVSYLTMELKADIPEALRPAMGRRVFGCDACQDACPLARKAMGSLEADFLTHKAGPVLDLGEILAMGPEREAFVARFGGSPVVRAGRDALVRNACIAAGNSGLLKFVPLLEELAAGDESPMVRRHARWGLERLAAVPLQGTCQGANQRGPEGKGE